MENKDIVNLWKAVIAASPPPPLPSDVQGNVAARVVEIGIAKQRHQAAMAALDLDKKMQRGMASPEAQRKRMENEARQDQQFARVISLSKQLWASVREWDDVLRLGGLVARGVIASPWYGALTTDAADNADWNPTVSALMTEINERGLLTVDGQAGEPEKPDGSLQRAYLIAIGVQPIVKAVVQVLNRVPGIIAFWTKAACPLPVASDPCEIQDNVVTYDYGNVRTGFSIGYIKGTISDIRIWNPQLARKLATDDQFTAFYAVDTVAGRNILLIEIVAALRELSIRAGLGRVTDQPFVESNLIPSMPSRPGTPQPIPGKTGGSRRRSQRLVFS